jgi:hypothetical protein
MESISFCIVHKDNETFFYPYFSGLKTGNIGGDGKMIGRGRQVIPGRTVSKVEFINAKSKSPGISYC